MRPLAYAGASAVTLLFAACSQPATDQTSTDLTDPNQTAETPAAAIDYNPDRNAYFGDIHIHTRNSFDAYIFNVRRTADDAYRFAKGDNVPHPLGFDMRIAGGPLDFYAVTDHAEYLGILPAMNTLGHRLNALPQAGRMFSDDLDIVREAFLDVAGTIRSGQRDQEIYDQAVSNSAWADNVAAAEAHYEPGRFTTFSGYEFTSTKPRSGADGFGAGNLHRNVFFADQAPVQIFSALDSQNPEDLWDWMDGLREEGLDAISIPHNSNVSDGQMFKTETFDGMPLTAAYADQRMRNEPLVEVTQVKGTSETHPDLSPNDEWANFEIYDRLIATSEKTRLSGGFVREAYGTGLALAESSGFNPYQFGLVGASDTHVVAGSYNEADFWSKVGVVDGTPELRGSVPPNGARTWDGFKPLDETSPSTAFYARWSASGLTGVWAEENTRESIFAAFRRKETYATTGPRMRVRFFAGFDFESAILSDPNLVQAAYSNSVPMGGQLAGDGLAPAFLVWAQRDPNAAALQRAQIIKVTADDEQVFDVACATGQPMDDTYRCPDNDASVDMATCTPTGSGAAELKTVWQDPTFISDQDAAYYVRVLENPTCRWSTWEALANGTPPRPDTAPLIQERAYTSPIWYGIPQ